MLKKLFKGLLVILLLVVVAAGAYAGKAYFDIKKTASNMHQPLTDKGDKSRPDPLDAKQLEPFSILLMGIDTGDDGRVDQGRSDTMLVAVVNPQIPQTTLVSLPRDTYTKVNGQLDKLNHAYAYGGASLAVQTVEELLAIPIDHYASVDMKGLKQMVDSVGGVSVNNQFEFTQDGHTFPSGQLNLNGEEALSYSRMRYEDPNGDYGRQGRQRQVITGIMKSAMNVNTVLNYPEILKVMAKHMQTDLDWQDMMEIQKNYTESFKQVKEDNLQGEGIMVNDISYQQIPEDELTRVQQLLQQQLKK